MSDIFAFLDDDAITIPGIKSKAHPEGKDYRFESPDAATGAWLTALSDITVRLHRGLKVTEAETARLKLDDDQEVDFMRRVMGDTYQALVDDGVSWVRMQRIVQYLHVATTMGIDAADKAAAEGVFTGGKARVPANRSERRAKPKGKGKSGTRQIR